MGEIDRRLPYESHIGENRAYHAGVRDDRCTSRFYLICDGMHRLVDA